MKPTLYAMLGITPDADRTTIVHAYNARLIDARGDPQVDIAALAHAYFVLTDTAHRVAYDIALQRSMEMLTGYDVTYEMWVTPEEADTGTTHTLTFHRADGQAYTLDIAVPPGAYNGLAIGIPGAGGPSVDGLRRGVLIAVVCITRT